MSVAVLKADNELGYWEYNVRTEDHGEWNLELTRMDKAPADMTKSPDMYAMHVRVTWQGEEFFSSWPYGEDAPFLTFHDMNGIGAAAAVEVLAHWVTMSMKRADILAAKERLQEMLGGALGDLGLEAVVIGIDKNTGEHIAPEDPRVSEQYYLRKEDLDRLLPHPKATYAVYMELHHYGMATTTPEWRTEVFGDPNPEPTKWGQCDGECGHEHE
jgi:hypothetical protein